VRVILTIHRHAGLRQPSPDRKASGRRPGPPSAVVATATDGDPASSV
jgi:hypothetical protein